MSDGGEQEDDVWETKRRLFLGKRSTLARKVIFHYTTREADVSVKKVQIDRIPLEGRRGIKIVTYSVTAGRGPRERAQTLEGHSAKAWEERRSSWNALTEQTQTTGGPGRIRGFPK